MKKNKNCEHKNLAHELTCFKCGFKNLEKCKECYPAPRPPVSGCSNCKNYPDGEYGNCGDCLRMIACTPFIAVEEGGHICKGKDCCGSTGRLEESTPPDEQEDNLQTITAISQQPPKDTPPAETWGVRFREKFVRDDGLMDKYTDECFTADVIIAFIQREKDESRKEGETLYLKGKYHIEGKVYKTFGEVIAEITNMARPAIIASARTEVLEEARKIIEGKKGDEDAYPRWNDALDEIIALLEQKKTK